MPSYGQTHPEARKSTQESGLTEMNSENKIIDDTLKPQLESAIKEFKGTFKA
jgi:hypothetical protein